MFRKWFTLGIVVLISLFSALPVFADSTGPSAVYVMTNASTGNQVIAYARAVNGSLSYLGTFATGGQGSGLGLTVPIDPLGSQNSLLVSPNGKWLFAVNAGSNSVSAFKTGVDGLTLTDTESSNGSFPVSLTYHDGLLYVLNAGGDGSISGFRVSDQGKLSPINNSTRSLQANTPSVGSQPHILESPAQVGFSPDGSFLVVTDKGGVSGVGRILTFHVGANGRPDDSFVATRTAGPVPFSFIFDASGHLVVVDAAVSTVTTYALQPDGSLATLSAVATGQAATCWIAANGQTIFTDNTGSSTVSALSADSAGALTLLNAVAAATGAGTAPLDMGISADGQYLYNLQVAAGRVGEFHINADGSLTTVGTIGGFPAVSGAQGIAVY